MTRAEASSNAIMRTTLIVSAAITGVIAVIGAIAGSWVAGPAGLLSALVGVLLAAVFLAITAASILIGNRWFGAPAQMPIFFGIVLGGWLVKLVLFIGLLLVVRYQPWVQPYVFFFAVIASVIASLVVDIVVMARARVPYVGEIALPTSVED